MCAPSARRRGEAGFSLIEIMISLLLLAIGLLGVEALGVNASRMMARAEKQTVWMGVAADTLERTVSHLREGTFTAALPLTQSYVLSGGDTMKLRVTATAVNNAGVDSLWTVQASVYPNRRGTLLQRRDSIGMVSSVLR